MMLTKQLSIALLSITYLFSVSCNNGNVAANKTTDTTVASKENIPPPPPIDPDKAKFERKPMVYDSTKTYVYLTFDDDIMEEQRSA
jgi:hypothetical protein